MYILKVYIKKPRLKQSWSKKSRYKVLNFEIDFLKTEVFSDRTKLFSGVSVKYRSLSKGVVIDISGGSLLPDYISTAGSVVPRSIELGCVQVKKLFPDLVAHY